MRSISAAAPVLMASFALATGGGCGENGSASRDASPAADGGAGVDGSGPIDAVSSNSNFSFFVTSLRAMQALADNPDGFGGDLR